MACDENPAALKRILTVDIEQEIIKINENKLEDQCRWTFREGSMWQKKNSRKELKKRKVSKTHQKFAL